MSNAPATFFYEKTDAFDELVEGDTKLFESRTRLLIFAASVGYHRGKRVEDHDENGEMRWNYISQNQRLSVVVSALAYADTNDPSVILDPERQIDSLTSYGAGGWRILEREVIEEPGDNLDNLVEFLNNHRDKDRLDQGRGVLEDIEREISSLQTD